MLDAPALDAPWLPEMDVLTSVHTASDARVPPVRSINLEATLARRAKFSNLHAFSSYDQENSSDTLAATGTMGPSHYE
jgi:hypothetical protein